MQMNAACLAHNAKYFLVARLEPEDVMGSKAALASQCKFDFIILL